MDETLTQNQEDVNLSHSHKEEEENRDDFLLESLTRLDPRAKQAALANSDPPPLNELSKNLGNAMGDPNKEKLELALQALRPRIGKVTDPVAFLTSAEKNAKNQINYGKGSFAQAVADPAAESGFYELAKSECAALAGEVVGLLNSGVVSTAQAPGLTNLSVMLGNYSAVYAAIQGSKGITAFNVKKAQALTASVREKVNALRESFQQVPEEILGSTAGTIRTAIDEIALFVESWETVAMASGNTSADSRMSGLFLQTVERERQILNNYGKLDDRGGDNTGTAKMALLNNKGTIKDGAQADAEISQRGGLMATAMKTYGLEPEQEMLREQQMQKVLARYKAGEFKTEAEFITAFQQTVGGGATSRSYMKDLESEARALWNAQQAKGSANAETAAYTQANASQQKITGNIGATDKAITARDGQANSREQNVGGYDDMDAATKTQLLKSGTLSAQEEGRINMDQQATDRAYDNAMRFQALAKAELEKARQNLKAADDQIQEGVSHHSQALQYLAQAKLHGSYVKHRGDAALSSGLRMLDQEVISIEQTLVNNDAIRAQLIANRQKLDAMIDARTQNVDNYNPEKLQVPVPTVVMDGMKLENETYAKVSVDLSGPAFGVFWWIGGAEGQLSNTTTVDGKGLDNWTKASIKVYAGLKANLWLVEAGVKISGFFEAQKKGPATLIETLEAGTDELGRWAYAWWYELGSMGDEMGKVMSAAQMLGDKSYERLQNTAASGSVGELGQAVDRESDGMRSLHDGLTTAMTKVFSNGPGKTEVKEDEIADLATEAVPVDDIVQSFQNIKKSDDNAEVLARLGQDREVFNSNIASTRDEAVKEIRAVDPGQNNPNVKFEAGVGIEGFVGASIGKSVKLSFSAAKVWSITDGDKEGFDYNVQEKVSFKLNTEFKLPSGKTLAVEFGAEPKKEGWEVGVDVTLPYKAQEGQQVDGSAPMQMMREIFESQGAGGQTDMEAWLKKLADDMKAKFSKSGEDYDYKGSASTTIKLGGSVLVDPSFSVKKWAVKFSVVSKLERGSKFGTVAYEAGNTTTFTSDDAARAANQEAPPPPNPALINGKPTSP